MNPYQPGHNTNQFAEMAWNGGRRLRNRNRAIITTEEDVEDAEGVQSAQMASMQLEGWPSTAAAIIGPETNKPVAMGVVVEEVDPNVFCPVAGVTMEQHDIPIVDKMLGAIWGAALGDAFGLSTEFETKKSVAALYDDGGLIPFPNYYETPHNSRFAYGMFTDDFTQLLLIMQSINASKTYEPEARDVAFRLRKWIATGHRETGQYAAMGLGATVARVCKDARFLKDPHVASEAQWEQSGRTLAANGSVMRCAILGCHRFTDLEKVIQQTEEIGKVTHWDPRCRSSCLVVTLLIAQILQGIACSTKDEIDLLVEFTVKKVLKRVPELQGVQKRQFVNYVNMAHDLNLLKLDEPEAIGFCDKAMACAIFALRTELGFHEFLDAIAKQAGDADTNSISAAAVYAAKHGYKCIPSRFLRAVPCKKWVDEEIVKFLKIQAVI